MKLKKNPEKDLNQKNSLYFIIGILFVLAILFISLEWKSTDNNEGFDLGETKLEAQNNKDSRVILETKAVDK